MPAATGPQARRHAPRATGWIPGRRSSRWKSGSARWCGTRTQPPRRCPEAAACVWWSAVRPDASACVTPRFTHPQAPASTADSSRRAMPRSRACQGLRGFGRRSRTDSRSWPRTGREMCPWPVRTTTDSSPFPSPSLLPPTAGSRRVTVTQVGLHGRRGKGHRFLGWRPRLMADRDSRWRLLPDRRRLLPDRGQPRDHGDGGRTSG